MTPESIFRGCSRGNEVGPLLSQFLLKDIPYGSLLINQRQQTVVGEAVAGASNADYLTKYPEWLSSQNGRTNFRSDMLDGTRRYIRNMRDIGRYVQVDALYEAYLNACLILLGLGTPVDDGNPYKEPVTGECQKFCVNELSSGRSAESLFPSNPFNRLALPLRQREVGKTRQLLFAQKI